jgi:ankyrin repeat protein
MTFEKVIMDFSTRGLRVADVQRYLDAGGDVNFQGSGMAWTLLHFPAENGNCDVIQLLASRTADLNIPDRNGWTALHLAVDSDLDTSETNSRRSLDLPTARLLIELGADETVRSPKGLIARDIARDYGQESLYDSIPRRNRR